MSTNDAQLAAALFSEILSVDQLARNRLGKALPKGLELSQFVVLNQLAHTGAERSPAQLAQSFHVTRGAMTNTLTRLASAGYVHIHPDWDDARRKRVTISPAGRVARDAAMEAVTPILDDLSERLGSEALRAALPVMRDLRVALGRK